MFFINHQVGDFWATLVGDFLITKSTAREEREKMLLLKHRFSNRITSVKFGKESLDSHDYGNAIRKFSDYLTTIAEVKKVRDFYLLRTVHFDSKKDVTEMLMISHLFFEMARMYDAVPKFVEETQKCLDQFVHFSANQPYQVVNSELVRKYLKKSSFKNPQLFRSAYEQIYVQSKKCYVVTFCYGPDHAMTQDYRLFKDWLLETPSGREMVRHYYRYSSVIVPRFEQNVFVHSVSQICLKPLLLLFSKTVLPFILKR